MTDIDKIKKEFDNKIRIGADVKQLQYAPFAIDQVSDTIDLTRIIDETFFPNKKDKKSNVLLINLEKDEIRYHSAVDEFKKLSLTGFVHIKGTYWKNKDKMVNDMAYVIDFLSKFNNQVSNNKLEMNDFSEFNDKNIVIQDGPLACYCSHLRSMIYGYLNFSDYTIIVEDDVLISNTEKIETYLKMIPNDWDVICFNACPLNVSYQDQPFYKLKNTFHSTHFYIIRNSVFELLFEKVYPIYDQIDILIANLYDTINIYNIVDTVYQKNFSTNTQNNLYVIMNSPNYKPIREYIFTAQIELEEYIKIKLPDNDMRHTKIAYNIMYDVVYNYITHNYVISDYKGDTITFNVKDNSELVELFNEEELKYFNKIYDSLFILINCCIKGIDVQKICIRLLKDIKYIIDCFDLHNTIDLEYNKQLKAYNYGSSANIYLIPEMNIIVKVYNDKLRWVKDKHNDIDDIFNRELKIIDKLKYAPSFSLLLNQDRTKRIIKMSYKGESLYENFILPPNWKLQLKILFNLLSSNLIVYPEFNLKNIVVLDKGYGKGLELSLIDFGLAEMTDNFNNLIYKDIIDKNIDNCNVFIEILEKLNEKMSSNNDIRTNQILYLTLLNNYRLENKYQNNVY